MYNNNVILSWGWNGSDTPWKTKLDIILFYFIIFLISLFLKMKLRDWIWSWSWSAFKAHFLVCPRVLCYNLALTHSTSKLSLYLLSIINILTTSLYDHVFMLLHTSCLVDKENSFFKKYTNVNWNGILVEDLYLLLWTVYLNNKYNYCYYSVKLFFITYSGSI